MTATARAHTGRTVAALAALCATLPVDLAVVGLALAQRRPPPSRLPGPVAVRTILLTGGKMTKALQLARSFHLAGHRVVLVESAKYRFTGHRFSKAVDAFHCVPEPSDPGYAQALLDIVRREGVDVVVPVSSPAASVPDARARSLLDDVCDVVHGHADTVAALDDKSEFSRLATSLGLSVPDTHRITDARQVEEFDFPEGRTYILKRIAYHPVGRTDLTPLTRKTPERNAAFARSLAISADDPWILQEFIPGREYCTHATVRDGAMRVYCCCESSAFQVNYAHVDKPRIRHWVEHLVKCLELTGQVSFDFIEAEDGTPYAIECNPRTHSAITVFGDDPRVAGAYLDAQHVEITPAAEARATYWTYHELWRLLSGRGGLRTVLQGRDAIFSRWDPLPYLMVHHLQIPSLLLANLRSGRGWSRIDFNIGKLVEAGGD
ncbi:ATP-grasp domain-containing protein [Mycolicibacterium arseniciresistens]|uniref:ATP-grasp domain-containing protein n=1 Tax=Mycolicibacterium arseniciresistens TaxID=3062257 RepID=A0ABT8UGX3_9MYCO|nr:ATP-grasp domain-containing protein [Mycolicibacterium arseniciresistens]MDO3637023.1 ATP-grasp domain-containing protein [Mycolicibacterium arseniciresistens]